MNAKLLKEAMLDLITVLDLTDEETGKPVKPEKDEKKLKTQITEAAALVEPGDTLEDETIEVLRELGAWVEEEKPTKKGKKTEPEPEEEETEEVKEEEVEEETLENQIEAIDDLEELKELVLDNEEFKPLRKKLSTFKKIGALKDAMFDLLVDEPEPEVEEKEEKPAKKKETVKKEEGKKNNPFKKEGPSFQEIADNLLKENAPQKKIIETFAKLYKESKGVTDSEYIAKRAGIYMNIAKKKK